MNQDDCDARSKCIIMHLFNHWIGDLQRAERKHFQMLSYQNEFSFVFLIWFVWFNDVDVMLCSYVMRWKKDVVMLEVELLE